MSGFQDDFDRSLDTLMADLAVVILTPDEPGEDDLCEQCLFPPDQCVCDLAEPAICFDCGRVFYECDCDETEPEG